MFLSTTAASQTLILCFLLWFLSSSSSCNVSSQYYSVEHLFLSLFLIFSSSFQDGLGDNCYIVIMTSSCTYEYIALVLSIILWFLTSVFLFFHQIIDGNRKLTANQRPLNHGHERKAVFGNANHFTIISAVFIMHTELELEHSMCIFYMHKMDDLPFPVCRMNQK